MSLAQRLNELAVANSQGLLNDDEYRLLRQNVFEQYSGSVSVPVEAPIVPTACVQVTKLPSIRNQRRLSASYSNEPTSTSQSPFLSRTKVSVSSNIVNLIRRVTGRRPSHPPNDQSTTKHLRKINHVNHPEDTHKSSPVIPRFVTKKPPNLQLLQTSSSRSGVGSPELPCSSAPRSSSYYVPYSPNESSSPIISSSQVQQSAMSDVFDESNLFAVDDIIKTIAITEDEARKLIEAFNDLEASIIRRIQKRSVRRLTTTPSNVSILLPGKEWREHRLLPSPSSLTFDRRGPGSVSVESNADCISIRSGSSNKTTLSQSKSIASQPKHVPSSPIAPTLHRVPSVLTRRKNSVSSSSSQGNTVLPNGVLGVPSASSLSCSAGLSHSTSRLTLQRLPEDTISSSTHGPGSLGDLNDVDEHYKSEITEIRQRREDLSARYKARLEFLRAKLKSAQLREKLLKK